ncbi:lipase 3-like [Venturia canescens]|uniref:lipase 3-like n=1 Tax=Venturia canescens TaxID=32260 RepID=UPI001C9CDA62|nr:lipase 3-like [Venturia canescens]
MSTREKKIVKERHQDSAPGRRILESARMSVREMNKITNEDEVHMTTPELTRLHNYHSETHFIWTEDGYRLEVHRVIKPDKDATINNGKSFVNVPHGDETIRENTSDDVINSEYNEKPNLSPLRLTESTEKSSKPAVLLHHGLLSSSADWILLGPGKALAYELCDNGYDVWLGNARGNRYSQYHKKYTTKNKEFWDFSWHEMGLYDVPAMIDYILDNTGQTSLLYIGYSQGTTAFFVMASERPEYCGKVKAMVCLAPIAFLSNQRSPLLKCVVPLHIVMKWAQSYCNINEWFPRNKLQASALGTLMRNAPDTFTKTFCACWFYLVAGFGSDQLDKSMLPIIFGHFPAGASAKQIIHYSQTIQSGIFRRFDYGTTKNTKLYGVPEPPAYKLDKVKVPVAIFYSENDFLNHPNDVDKLADALPNVLEKHKIEYAKFNHIDYLWGRDARSLLYNKIIKILKRF